MNDGGCMAEASNIFPLQYQTQKHDDSDDDDSDVKDLNLLW